MYEVRKNDYNTVRFLPEYNSGFGNDFQHRQNKKRRQRRAVLAVIIAVIVIAAAAFVIHRTYFSPADKFMRAFSDSDYALCHEIFEENAYDTDFVNEIREPVIQSADAVFAQYMNGDINSADADLLLKNYNNAVCGEFEDEISELSGDITAVEGIKADYETFKTQCSEKSFGNALVTAMKVMTASRDYSIDYSDEISAAILDNYYYFKAEAFYDIAGAYNSRSFDSVTEICEFMLQFSADADFTSEQTVLKNVTSGELPTVDAARNARKTGAAAEEKADLLAPDPDASGEGNTGTEA